MKVKKELLRFGKHHAKGGTLDATPAWAQAKVDQFQKLKSKGIKPPVAWGHTLSALPLDPQKAQDEQRFQSSKFKAGDVTGLSIEGDKLFFEAEIPAVKRIDEHGNLIHEIEIEGKKVEGAISEVSGGFMDWMDGTGELHQDALIHVALCPLPVSANQSGFQKVETIPTPILLSTSTWFGASEAIESTDTRNTHRTQLATEPVMPDDEKKPKPGDDKPEEKKGAEAKADGEKKPDAEGEKPAEINTGKPVQTMLQEMGSIFNIGLPESLPSDPKAAFEMLYVAACATRSPASQEQMTMAPSPNGLGGQGVMLSTAIKDTGFAGTFAKNLDKSTRDALKARIEALKPRGLPEAQYKLLMAQVPALELSVNAESGDLIPSQLHLTLDVLESMAPSRKELATDSELTPVDPPAGKVKTDEEIYAAIEESSGIPSPIAATK